MCVYIYAYINSVEFFKSFIYFSFTYSRSLLSFSSYIYSFGLSDAVYFFFFFLLLLHLTHIYTCVYLYTSSFFLRPTIYLRQLLTRRVFAHNDTEDVIEILIWYLKLFYMRENKWWEQMKSFRMKKKKNFLSFSIYIM